MTEQELLSALEAIIYAADEPATLDQIVAAITGEWPNARTTVTEIRAGSPPSDAATAEIPAAQEIDAPSAEIFSDAQQASGAENSATRSEAPDASRAQLRASLRVEVRSALDKLVASYAADERGIEIRKVAGGWKMYTKPQHHELVRRFIKSLRPAVRLTMPALETLSVIAYKQPATLPEINEIRGVNCGGVVKTLLERRLITTAGRKDAVGRPILYRTSKDFLMRFGLADLDELPSLKEFEQLAQAALGADDGIAPTEPEEPSAESPSESVASTQLPTESPADMPAVSDSPAESPADAPQPIASSESPDPAISSAESAHAGSAEISEGDVDAADASSAGDASHGKAAGV